MGSGWNRSLFTYTQHLNFDTTWTTFLYHFSQYVIFTLLLEQSQAKANSIKVAGLELEL